MNKKGFTLLELLGVIILLAVIALIATPVVLNVVESAKESADKSTVYALLEAARLYKSEAMFDKNKENKINNTTDIFKEVILLNKPEEGKLYINKEGQTAVSVVIRNKCYIKNLEEQDISVRQVSDCNLGWIGNDKVKPTVNQEVVQSNINSNGWYKEDIYIQVNVVDNESGVKGYKRCISNTECEPTSELYNSAIIITNESASNVVCVIGVDNQDNESEKNCITYKLDKTKPTINGVENSKIELDSEIDLKNGITSEDSLSGMDGEMVITPNTIDTSKIGTTTVEYKVIDLAGNETVVSRNIEVLGGSPSITFNSTGTFNNNGWAKSDFYINAIITDNSTKGIKSIKWCSTTESSCTPTATASSVSVLVENESASNQVCVEAIDNNDKVTILCSDSYKLDKTSPSIEGVNDVTIQKGNSIDLSNGVSYNDTLSGIEGSISISPTSVDTSKAGTTNVTYKVVDKAGNARSIVRKVIVDADGPLITYTVQGNPINSNGWARSEFYVKGNITDQSGLGIKSAKWCSNTNGTCTPIADLNGTELNSLISSESNNNRICIQATDNNNKTSEVICSDTYKLDKTVPIAGTASFSGTVGSNNWYTSNVTVNVTNGSDSLSGHSSTTSNISSITSNTTGTTITITTTDLAGNTSTRNYTIKVDKNAPTLTAKGGTVTITQGDNYIVSNYFNSPSYSISGGTLSCSPTNTSVLGIGNQTVSCTANGNNGLTTSASITIVVNAIIYNDGSGANIPQLAKGMIPIMHNGTNWIYADTSTSWYNYNNKKWANAVVLKNGITKNVGDIISENEIGLWYVWIPRYKYTIFNGNNESVPVQEIKVTFEKEISKTGTVTCTDATNGSNTPSSSEICTDSTNGSIINGTSTYTHPAFTFGVKELTGIWVGKFELSGSTSSTLQIVPNVNSLRSTTVSDIFKGVQNIETNYNLTNIDSHMIKNMEWGAIAYLTQSNYGLASIGIGINNVSNKTGCGATAGSSQSTTCNSYNTTEGMKASTTGNIYGIYDMSGGGEEYVMGNEVDSNGNFFPSSSDFSTIPDVKYYDSYTYDTTNVSHGRGKLGDATKETLMTFGNTSGGWFKDYAFFPNKFTSWFIRGGHYNHSSNAGIFNFHYANGWYSGYYTSRAVLVME